MVALTGLHVEPPPVGDALGVFVRVGVRVNVGNGPVEVLVGVFVRVGVRVDVAVPRVGVFVGGMLPPSKANSIGVR